MCLYADSDLTCVNKRELRKIGKQEPLNLVPSNDERCTNKKKMKNKKYRNAKIFASVII